jgi:hypothetical protein
VGNAFGSFGQSQALSTRINTGGKTAGATKTKQAADNITGNRRCGKNERHLTFQSNILPRHV